MDVISTLIDRLPEGAVITRRKGSWAVEMPGSIGYRSCGITLDGALDHALNGDGQRDRDSLETIAGLTFDRTGANLDENQPEKP